MPPKKKSKAQPKKAKKSSAKTAKATTKTAAAKKRAGKIAPAKIAPAKIAPGKPAPAKTGARKTGASKKSAKANTTLKKTLSQASSTGKRSAAGGQDRRRQRGSVNTERDLDQEIRGRRPAGSASDVQSGDLQGLSWSEEADSESVGELVDEGSYAEAEAVAGVEESDSEDEREVHTHEVPEDDVPEEYLDEQ